MATLTNNSRISAAKELKNSGTNVHNVLKILNSRLGSEGNIKESKDVAYVNVLMSEAVKLVDRCMFLNVLQSTRSNTILRAMLDTGGWATLHSWLQQCRSEDGSAFLLELLRLYKHLPVTVELLRQNSCAKDIKQLMKSSDEKIASLAKGIVTSWMDKVKEKGSESSRHSDKSSSGHRHSHSSSSKSSSAASSSTKEKTSSQSNSSSSSLSSNKDKHTVKHDDVDPARVKTLQDSPDHITSKLNHRTLSADRIHTNVVANDDSTSSNNSMSVDTDFSQPQQPPVNRPKTVKMIGSKMRSTGLELETPLPPSKKSVSSPSDKDKLVQTAQTLKPQSSKKMALDKKSPTHSTASSASSTHSSSSAVESKSKIKLIPAKPRAPEIYESSGFMDALSSTDTLIGRRKRKLSTQTSSKPTSSGTMPTSPEDKKTPPTFPREPMETDDNSKKSDTVQTSSAAALPNADEKSVTDQPAVETVASASSSEVEETAVGKDVSVSVESVSEDNCSKESSVEPASKKKKVKGVSWAEESKLCSFFYFQLDENERVNVNKIKDFAEIRKHEQEMERQMMRNVRRMAHDVMTEKQLWRKPFPISDLSQVVVPGCNSKQREIQKERELGVLQVLYFSKSSIPDSAAEPEPEYFELIEPKIIPLTDETGQGNEVVYNSYPMSNVPTTLGINQPMTSLPPAIASLLSATVNQAQNAPGGSSSAPSLLMPANAAPSQPSPSNVSLPPLPVFLNMPFPTQQQIFQAMLPHVQQQMISSLPLMLQQQLGPLMSNGGPQFGAPPPGALGMPPDVRPSGSSNIGPGPGQQSFQPVGQNVPRRMPQPLMDIAVRRPGPPDGALFPPRPPPAAMMPVRGGMHQSNRICTHFMAGSCRYGNSCRNIHPPRDGISTGGAVMVGHDSPH